jgi:hypothetical protein
VAQAVTTGDKFFDKDSVFNNSILWQRGYHTNLLQGISLYLNKSANSWQLLAGKAGSRFKGLGSGVQPSPKAMADKLGSLSTLALRVGGWSLGSKNWLLAPDS